MIRMRIEDIKIPKAFALTSPKEEKMCECREFWRYEGKQDRPIVVNHNNILIDGYVMYLTLLEHKEKYAYVRKLHKKNKVKNEANTNLYKNNPTIYIYGRHPKSQKTLVWRVPEKWIGWADDLHIGDRIYCKTKYGVKPVIVQEVEILNKCPVSFTVKKVHSRKIIKNLVECDEKYTDYTLDGGDRNE